MAWQTAAPLADVPLDAPFSVRVGTAMLVLVRQGDTVHAFDGLCPHKFAPLAEGHIEDGCLACPVHDAHFQMDGTPRDGDGWAGILQAYPVRVQDGVVEVEL